MIVVAGPPGSGKSSRFPLSRFGVDWFNADDRAAELNLGSFHKIPAEIRSRVNVEFQQWILSHITARDGFAIETTLRSPITFEQARLAHGHGFWTTMDYVSVGSVEESVRRIAERSYRGGHSASERLVADITRRVQGISSPHSILLKAALKSCEFTTTPSSAGTCGRC